MRRFASIGIAALVVGAGVAAVRASVKAAEEPPHTVVAQATATSRSATTRR